MSKTAHIVAVRAASVAPISGLGFGIKDLDSETENNLFANSEVWIGPRPVLEVDPSFLQPIPYIVIKDGDKVLTYIRSPKGGENRLHNKAAIGFGGHIDVVDVVTNDAQVIDLRATLNRAALRELEEEANIHIPEATLGANPELLRWTHIIHSEATSVDAVHLGFVATVDLSLLPTGTVQFEDAIANVQSLRASELLARAAAEDDSRVELETWTRLVLEATSD